MSKKVVFTIVAKNYLPLARALKWSIDNKNKTDVDFIIFLADEEDGLVTRLDAENIIPVSNLEIPGLTDWAFKYNVTEFCTSVKPSCFKYVFEKLNADAAIYFDPDIFVFNDLQSIFDDLNDKDIVVTPHYLTNQINYTGDQKETMTLFVGIFNFGFVAFKNTKLSLSILNWWENRLSDQCYADRQDALHTDQKWADFLPVYAGDRLHISTSLGYNLAPWNIFERKIVDGDTLCVINRLTKVKEKLIFVHFAGFAPDNLTLIHKDFWDLTIDKYPDYDIVRKLYIEVTDKFDFKEMKSLSYTYSTFTNGDFISDFHRRLYRAMSENGYDFINPFDVNNEFYQILAKSKMVLKKKPVKRNSKTYQHFDSQRNKINFLLKSVFRLLGADRYFLLMGFMNRYTRPENQTFLLKKDIKKIY